MSIRNRCQIVGKKPLWVDNENGETFENLTEKNWGDFFVHSDHRISSNTTHFLITEEEIWRAKKHWSQTFSIFSMRRNIFIFRIELQKKLEFVEFQTTDILKPYNWYIVCNWLHFNVIYLLLFKKKHKNKYHLNIQK